jgi:hypothetical protein
MKLPFVHQMKLLMLAKIQYQRLDISETKMIFDSFTSDSKKAENDDMMMTIKESFPEKKQCLVSPYL